MKLGFGIRSHAPRLFFLQGSERQEDRVENPLCGVRARKIAQDCTHYTQIA